MVLTIIAIIFFALYAALIFFYYINWLRLREPVYSAADVKVFISIIIAARNEEKTLPLLLADLQQQKYSKDLLEVIVVNDFSTDRTGEVARAFTNIDLKVIFPAALPDQSSKKIAIATGISEAKGELMVITDADCRVTDKWLSTIAAFYKTNQAAFIAAPVKFEHDNSLLQIFQALDFITLQGITAASASSGFHNMCNGANLAYTKSAFIEVNGFEGIDKVATGDDVLLMHKIAIANPGKVFYLKSKDAVVSTQPMPTWKNFIMQRRRWGSKTLVYEDNKIIAVLAFVYFFNLFLLVFIGVVLLHPMYWWYILVAIVLKTIIEFPFVFSVASFYGDKKLMRYFLPFQPIHILYMVLAGFLSQFGKYEWKGRRTR